MRTLISYLIRVFIIFSIALAAMNIATAMTKQIKSNGKIISYSDVGQGRPLVLIHAFPSDQRLWVPQQNELNKKFRVITVDLWGFGLSSETDGQAVTMEQYADEVKQLLDALHIDNAIIGGESMGGYVSLAFAKKYSAILSGLVLSNTQSIADSPETKAKREAAALDVLNNGPAQFINGLTPKLLSVNADDATREALNNILNEQSAKGIASALRGMALRDDASDVLVNLQIPVLIITSELDNLISPQQSKNMHEIAKNSKLIVIPGAGHLSSLEQVERWNVAVMNEFGSLH